MAFLAFIQFDNFFSIDRKSMIWVDNNAKKARVGVDQFSLVADLQVVEDRSIIEEGQVSHILALLKLGWIDLTQLLRLENLFLKIVNEV